MFASRHSFLVYHNQSFQREEWETAQLNEEHEIEEVYIDAAPFQLVRKTPLYKIHTIFSMLQLTKAYVVDCGRLVGVVAQADVRRALESSLSDASVQRRAVNENVMRRKSGIFQLNALEKVHDVLMPPLEVVGAEMQHEGDEALVRREKDAMRRRASALKHAQREDVHQLSIHKAHPTTSEAEQLVEAVAYLRKISMNSPSE